MTVFSVSLSPPLFPFFTKSIKENLWFFAFYQWWIPPNEFINCRFDNSVFCCLSFVVVVKTPKASKSIENTTFNIVTMEISLRRICDTLRMYYRCFGWCLPGRIVLGLHHFDSIKPFHVTAFILKRFEIQYAFLLCFVKPWNRTQSTNHFSIECQISMIFSIRNSGSNISSLTHVQKRRLWKLSTQTKATAKEKRRKMKKKREIKRAQQMCHVALNRFG